MAPVGELRFLPVLPLGPIVEAFAVLNSGRVFTTPMIQGVAPDRWDITGAAISLAGAAVILFGPRS